MFDTALQLISDYLGKSFLVSFFFPSLFFWTLNLALGVLSLGLDDVLRWWGEQDGQVQAFLTAAFLVLIFLTAYLLRIFMGQLTRFYQGEWGGLKSLLAVVQKRNEETWEALHSRSVELGDKVRVLKARQKSLDQIFNRDAPSPSYGAQPDVSAMAREATTLYEQVRAWTVEDYLDDEKWQPLMEQLDAIQRRVLALSASELEQHEAQVGSGSPVDMLFRTLDESLKELVGCWEQDQLQVYHEWTETFPAQLNRVRPTRLGNHLAAAETYSFLRYNLDAAIIWPRLREILPEKFADRLSDAKMNMDLMLVLTTLALAFGVAWGGILLAAPDAALRVYKWVAAPIAFAPGLAVARLTYLTAAQSARAYGEIFKAAFDLYRWDLLKALHLDLPPSLENEKELWGQVSSLFYRNYPLQTPWKHPS